MLVRCLLCTFNVAMPRAVVAVSAHRISVEVIVSRATFFKERFERHWRVPSVSRRGLSAFRSLLKFNATNTTRKVCDVRRFETTVFFCRFFVKTLSKKKREKKIGIGKKVQKLEDDEKEATFIITPI